MYLRAAINALLFYTVLAVAPVSAQDADVTFEIPLNLTQLHPDIQNVQLECTVYYGGLVHGDKLTLQIDAIPVVDGRVVRTVTIVVPFRNSDFVSNPSGQKATYDCNLWAGATNIGVQAFNSGSAEERKVLALTPNPGQITGSFVW